MLADAALVIFTSGSTGLPKGVVLTHRAFAGKLEQNQRLLGFTADDVTLLVLNNTFSFGIWVALLTLLQGGTVVARSRFSPQQFVDTLCDAIEARGANAVPVFCGSLRGAESGLFDLLAGCDALVATVLAAGGTRPGDVVAGGDDDAWDVGALAALDVPVLQGLCLTSSRAAWQASDGALSPMDAAMQVAMPKWVRCG